MIQTCKWMGTLLCAGGILLTSFNIFPANIILGGLGSALWVFVSIKVKDAPLFTIEFYATIVYAMGLTTWFFTPPNEPKLPESNGTIERPQLKINPHYNFDEEEPKTISTDPLKPV